eukprot:TRINITY_DN8087_c0_g1_i1.p1 TRINITY_DN8087_c0_g1~~TRINITY_DN8087_c0_g1_i1.p1  ORF type:complete len:384 (+),score=65.53 TRINITY_DN8087_c0_g1_i1:1091-2242(+)
MFDDSAPRVQDDRELAAVSLVATDGITENHGVNEQDLEPKFEKMQAMSTLQDADAGLSSVTYVQDSSVENVSGEDDANDAVRLGFKRDFFDPLSPYYNAVDDQSRPYLEGDGRLYQLIQKKKENPDVTTVYYGTWLYREKHGWGFQQWANGTRYLGAWEYHFPHGKGQCEWPIDPNTTHFREYRGDWSNGKRQGRGKQTWHLPSEPMLCSQRSEESEFNSDAELYVSYEGEWFNDKPHGKGRVDFPDGSYHEGYFEEGFPSGYGERVWSKARATYKGGWRFGVMDGKGVMSWKDGLVIYDGEWKEGKKSGSGKVTWFDINHGKKAVRKEFEGSFEDDARHGKGELRFPGRHTFHGQWNRGKKTSGFYVSQNGYECESFDVEPI